MCYLQLFHPSNHFIFTYCDTHLLSKSNCIFFSFYKRLQNHRIIHFFGLNKYLSKFPSHLLGTININESIFCQCCCLHPHCININATRVNYCDFVTMGTARSYYNFDDQTVNKLRVILTFLLNAS